MNTTGLADLFTDAADALGVVFTSPFPVSDVDETIYVYSGHFPGFASENGLIIHVGECPAGNSRESEFALSLFTLDHRPTIDSVKQLLKHWGWHGDPASMPDWV